MRCLIILIALTTCFAIDDIGIMSDRTSIQFEPCSRRGAVLYKIEVKSGAMTNEIVTTNAWLRLDSFAGVPNGPATLTVRSFCSDSSQSPPAVFRVNIQREPPAKPKAKIMNILTPSAPMPVEIEPVIMPPMPLVADGPHALPRGTNEAYAEFQRRIHSSMRRNQ